MLTRRFANLSRKVADLERTIHMMQKRIDSLPRIGEEFKRPPFAFVKITGYSAMGGETNRWTYSGTEQSPDDEDWADHANGRTWSDEILNLCEVNNDGAGVQGNSVDIDGDDFPAGFSMQPIQGSPVLIAWAVPVHTTTTPVLQWWVQYENAVDGTCT